MPLRRIPAWRKPARDDGAHALRTLRRTGAPKSVIEQERRAIRNEQASRIRYGPRRVLRNYAAQHLTELRRANVPREELRRARARIRGLDAEMAKTEKEVIELRRFPLKELRKKL